MISTTEFETVDTDLILPILECEVIIEFSDNESMFKLYEQALKIHESRTIQVLINDCHGIKVQYEDIHKQEYSYTYYYFNQINCEQIGDKIQYFSNQPTGYSTRVFYYTNKQLNCLFATSYKVNFYLLQRFNFDIEFLGKMLFYRLEDLNHLLLEHNDRTLLSQFEISLKKDFKSLLGMSDYQHI